MTAAALAADLVPAAGSAAGGSGAEALWLAGLFAACVLIGIFAVQAGVGGGVLFVPIVGGLFPFHLDYVRAAGLLVALASSLAAAPSLLRMNMASLRLALPASVLAALFGVGGAALSFLLPIRILQAALGAAILGIAFVFLRARPEVPRGAAPPDAWSRRLRLGGVYWETTSRAPVVWTTRRTPLGIGLFSGVGFMAGLFGLGAGWANVPVFNLVMGVPIKIAVATSALVIAFTTAPSLWMYYHRGAVLPAVMAPAVLGMMVGARIGVRFLAKARPRSIRYAVVTILLLAGLRSLLRGLGAPFV